MQGATTSAKVTFLKCMDEETRGIALTAAKACAPKAGVPVAKMESCFKSSAGDELLKAASKRFNDAFPSLVTVPHTFVNDKDIRADYELLRNELCADGAKSSACTYANKHQVVEAWNHEEISCEVA